MQLLNQIITEMSWPDKFNQIERKIRDEDMTMDELVDYFADEFDVAIVFNPSVGVPPFHVGGGGTSDKRLDDEAIKDSPKEVRDRLLGKFGMEIGIGPGINGSTKAAQVMGLMHILRHELSHIQQSKYIPGDKVERMTKQYISPEGDNPIIRVLYSVQPIERPAQAVDYASHLSRVGMTPSQFERAVSAIGAAVLEKFKAGEREIDSEEVYDMARSEIQHFSGIPQREIDVRSQAQGTSIDYSQLVSFMAAMGVVHASFRGGLVPASEKAPVKNQIRNFYKRVRKVYPKVKGYQKRHSERRQKSYEEIWDERAQVERAVRDALSAMGELFDAIERRNN
jgi:hypothetical protein